MTTATFRSLVWRYYREQGRHDLPWRSPQLQIRKDGTLDLYRVMVSEVMLQQTQVDRVLPFYRDFIQRFPTAKKLAVAPLSDVLKSWQGLGYNRRAKMLHNAAKILADIPRSNLKNLASGFDLGISELEKLPGVGPYTARAIAAFAYNQDAILIETNIRTAIIQHFFSKKEKVTDADIEQVLIHVMPKNRAREWYSALMDYGAHLKRSGISHNARSKGQVQQSRFIGSLREARGVILRELTHGPLIQHRLTKLLGVPRQEQMHRALLALCTEGLVQKDKNRWSLAE